MRASTLLARSWRRWISAILVLCLGLSSAESLWGDVPTSAIEQGEMAGASGEGSDETIDLSRYVAPGDDCPCLCACACTGAQRVLLSAFAFASVKKPLPLPPLREHDRAPPSLDPEPHIRPPRA